MCQYYQIYTGAESGRDITADQILQKLPEDRHIDSLIVGWSENMEIYHHLRAYTRERGIRLWLWFPVFSEQSEAYGFRQMINIATGEPFGAKVFDGDEKFDFLCPSQPALGDTLVKKYETLFQSADFDGIFLDRIRYPSMTMGLEALFGCRCRDCTAWFEEHGLSAQEIQDCYDRIQKKIAEPACNNPLGITGYRDGTYTFEDDTLTRLLALRAKRITDTVRPLAETFRQKGLAIGTDLFAPFLSAFVGQDYRQMGTLSDFAKPMLYRFTDTPAGVHFELEAIAKALSGGDPVRYESRLAFLRQVLGITGEAEDFFKRELLAIRAWEQAINRQNVFIPGIELHTAEQRPPVTIQNICDNVKVLKELGYESRVACWDILCVDKPAMDTFIHDPRGE